MLKKFLIDVYDTLEYTTEPGSFRLGIYFGIFVLLPLIGSIYLAYFITLPFVFLNLSLLQYLLIVPAVIGIFSSYLEFTKYIKNKLFFE